MWCEKCILFFQCQLSERECKHADIVNNVHENI